MNPLLAIGIILGWTLAVVLGASIASVYYKRREYREAIERKRLATEKYVASHAKRIDREYWQLLQEEKYR